MAVIEIKSDIEKIEKVFSRFQEMVGKPKEILEALGQAMIQRTQDRTKEGKDANGRPFAPLNPLYASIEKKGSGILIGEGGFRNGLMGSLVSSVSGNRLSWGSNKIYANVHQFGAIIKPVKAQNLVFRLGGKVQRRKSVTIPARPYLGFNKEDQEAVNETLRAFLGDLLKD